jgi:hypothetical protein
MKLWMPSFVALSCIGGLLQAQATNARADCPIDSSWANWAPRPPSYDERIALQLGEYAGVARDTGVQRESVTVVMLTSLGAAERARSIVQRELTNGTRPPQRYRFVEVTYSYRQLRSWLQCWLAGGGVRDLTAWGVSVRRNRVGLGVAADSIRPRVLEAVRRLGLPTEAFDVQVEVVVPSTY